MNGISNNNPLSALLIMSTLFAICAIVLASFYRRNAAVRHNVLLASLLGMLLSPFVLFTIDAETVSFFSFPSLSKPQNSQITITESDSPLSYESHNEEISSGLLESEDVISHESSLPGLEILQPESLPEEITSESTSNNRSSFVSTNWIAIIIGIWSIGTVFFLLGLIRGLWRMHSIVREAEPLETTDLRIAFPESMRSLGISNFPQVAISTKISGPTAVAIFGKRRILYPPRYLETLNFAELQQVMIHETAHLVRNDHRVLFLQQLCRAVYWWNPLIHILNRQLSRAREDLCDNFVLNHVEPTDYGDTLLRLSVLSTRVLPVASSLGLFSSRVRLEQRISGILDDRRRTMTNLRFTTRASIATIFALLTIFSTANLGTLKAQTNAGATRNETVNQNKPPNVPIPGPYRTQNPTVTAGGIPATQSRPQRSQKKSVDQRLDRLEQLIEKLLAQSAARSGGKAGSFRNFIPNRTSQPAKALLESVRRRAIADLIDSTQNPNSSSQNRSLRSVITSKKDKMEQLQSEMNRLKQEIKDLESKLKKRNPIRN